MVRRVLLGCLIALAPGAAYAYPFLPECPWSGGGFGIELMVPIAGTAMPINASFWVRTYVEPASAVVIDESTSSSVAVDEIATNLTASGGRLIELRPRQPLKANTIYTIRFAGGGLHGWTITSTFADDAPPARPRVAGAGPYTSESAECSTAGIKVAVLDPAEPVMHLYEDPDTGSVFEMGASFPVSVDGLIPTEPNASIRFRVVAVDLAGNRSAASDPLSATAGGGVVTRSVSQRDERGCECAKAPQASGLGLMLALTAPFTLLYRRRLAHRRRDARG